MIESLRSLDTLCQFTELRLIDEPRRIAPHSTTRTSAGVI